MIWQALGGIAESMDGILLTKAYQFWPLSDYLTGFGVPIGRYIERFRLPMECAHLRIQAHDY